MLLRIFIVFLLLLPFNSCWSANILVPFQGELSIALHKQFKEIDSAFKIGDGNALPLAQTYYNQNNKLSPDVRAWSLLIYAQVLLEMDGVQQAKDLLQDSILVDWSRMPSWIRAYRNLNLGTVDTYEGNYRAAEHWFEQAILLVKDAEIPEFNLFLLQATAENYRHRGKLDKSLSTWYEALQLAELNADSFAIADIHYGIGVIRYMRSEVKLAESEIDQAYNFYKRRNAIKKIAYGLSLKGLLAYQRKDFQSSIEKNLEAYRLRQEISDLKGQGESLNNLALSYMGMRSWRQALSYLEEAAQLKIRAKDLTQMTVVFNNMGYCYSQMDQPEKALRYFELALRKSLENDQMVDALTSYENIIRFHQHNSNYEQAFKAQQKLIALKDSLATVQRSAAMSEIQVKYETQKRDLEIESLQHKQTIITNRWLSLAIGLFFTIIFGILFVDNQKRKHRQQTQLLIKEDELKKADLKIVTDLLEYNRKKLTLYTENLLKKNEMVSQLEEKLKDSVDGKGKNLANSEKLMKDFSAVRILTDDDWEEFKDLFEQVHEGLLARLLRGYENLTQAEQRLFLLMKLKLSTKEIANILGVSPDSIKKGRYRLKRKIDIEENTSLQDFISSF